MKKNGERVGTPDAEDVDAARRPQALGHLEEEIAVERLLSGAEIVDVVPHDVIDELVERAAASSGRADPGCARGGLSRVAAEGGLKVAEALESEGAARADDAGRARVKLMAEGGRCEEDRFVGMAQEVDNAFVHRRQRRVS